MSDVVEASPLEGLGPSLVYSAGRPKIVAVMAPKGGVGKTTLSMGLLVAARRAGVAVAGIDMDEQRSLDMWGSARAKQRTKPGGGDLVDVPVTSLPLPDWRRLQSLGGIDLAVLDTAPGHVSDITSVEGVAATADLILIPTSPSMQDLMQVKAFHRRLVSPRSFFVLNKVRRTKSYASARTMLMGTGQLCAVDIPERDAVGVEYAKGLVLSDRGLPGSEFFDALWNFVAGQVGLPKLQEREGEGDHAA